jgi:hypothetical protein
VNRPSLVQPVDGRPVVSTGAGIILVVAGAILRFAFNVTFAHVAGVIVMLAGVFALLLSLLVWGPLSRRRSHLGATTARRRRLPGSRASTEGQSQLYRRVPGPARLARRLDPGRQRTGPG